MLSNKKNGIFVQQLFTQSVVSYSKIVRDNLCQILLNFLIVVPRVWGAQWLSDTIYICMKNKEGRDSQFAPWLQLFFYIPLTRIFYQIMLLAASLFWAPFPNSLWSTLSSHILSHSSPPTQRVWGCFVFPVAKPSWHKVDSQHIVC